MGLSEDILRELKAQRRARAGVPLFVIGFLIAGILLVPAILLQLAISAGLRPIFKETHETKTNQILGAPSSGAPRPHGAVRHHSHSYTLICSGVTLHCSREILGQDTITAEQDTVTAEQALKGVELATAMATHLHDKQWMKTFAADAGQLYLDDNYGVNVNMGRILNGDYQYGAQAAVQAWQETTTDPGDTGFMADDTPGVSGRLARLASIKFSDAAAGNCLQVLGQYRSHASANQAAHDLLSLTIGWRRRQQ